MFFFFFFFFLIIITEFNVAKMLLEALQVTHPLWQHSVYSYKCLEGHVWKRKGTHILLSYSEMELECKYKRKNVKIYQTSKGGIGFNIIVIR